MRERDLLISDLFKGISQTPPWSTFLERLRTATSSEYATLSFPPRSHQLERTTTILATRQGIQEMDQSGRRFFYHEDRYRWANSFLPDEGEVYGMADLFGTGKTPRNAFYLDLVQNEGVGALLQMRVGENDGGNCWVTVTRAAGEYSAADRRLLKELAPIIRGVLGLYVEREKAEFAASLHAETARRLQFGWFTLDEAGHILESDERGAEMLAQSNQIGGRVGSRISIRSAEAEQELFCTLKQFAATPGTRPHGILVSREPWLNLLLMTPRGNLMSTNNQPVAIACMHGDNLASDDRAEQIARFFALSRREGQLALALSRGLNLSEASVELGLKMETTRSYSKSLYSKIGARGHADLVRIVMSSVMTTAPID